METIDYAPPKRRFVPEGLDAGDWNNLQPSFTDLENRQIGSVADFEGWIQDISELESLLNAEFARRYIGMTCHTGDLDRRQKYLDFTQTIDPKAKIAFDRLDRLYLKSPFRSQIPRRRYEVLDRVLELNAALFREENVPLEARETEVTARYVQLVGSLTVNLNGVEKPLAQAVLEFEEPDRSHRESVWRKVSERRILEKDNVEGIFSELLALRQKAARNAGFSNYRDYRARKLRRFDYGVQECEQFHKSVLEVVVPVLEELDTTRCDRLRLDALRPWDLDVDPRGGKPFRPFSGEEGLRSIAKNIFKAVHPSFEAEFRAIEERNLLDLFSRPNKAPGGYQYFLEDIRLPFIFANAAGNHEDVQTLLHEGGHAFHSLASRNEPILLYRDPPMEFCEVASMGMEFLGLEHLEKVYSADETRRARRTHLERQIKLLAWIAIVDSFQHWVYTQKEDRVDERRACWRRLRGMYTPTLDWSGLERYLEIEWQRQGHIFRQPFYYIEYGIALLGALQLWHLARKDPGKAVSNYRAGLALGGSRPLPELFQAAGLRFEFGTDLMGPLVEEARDEWRRLS